MQTEPEKSRTLSDALMHRPVLSAAIFFIAGIVVQERMGYAPGRWLLIAFIAVVAALVGHRRQWASGALAVALLMAGLAAAQVERLGFGRDHIGHFAALEPKLAELEVVIEQAPRVIDAHKPYLSARQVTRGRVLRVKTVDGWRQGNGTVLLSVGEPVEALAIRQKVRVLGMLSRPMAAMNPGEFDWSHYYRHDRVMASLRVAQAGSVLILDDPGPNPLDRARAWTRAALERGFGKEKSLDHALLRALVLGDPDPQLRDVQEQFMRTGTSHHLAISGMHVTIVGLLVYFCCRVARLSPRKAVWIGMSVVAAYVLMAMPSAPVIRSGLLCLAIGLGIVMRRSVDGVQLLALSVLAMLAVHPLDLYAAGFQLSFATVFGLMLFTGPLRAYFDSFRDIDQVVAESFRRPPRHVLAWRRVKRRARDLLIAGMVAWAVATPLVLHHFNQMNPWAVLASLLLAIPVMAALVGGVLKIVITGVMPWMAPLWANLAGWPVVAMRAMVEWLATLPGSDVALARPSGWMLAMYYTLFLIPLLPRLRAATPLLAPGKKAVAWPRRVAAVGACVVPVLLPLALMSGGTGSGDVCRVAVLSVGEGQCAVVHLPSGATMVLDAGSASMSDVSRQVLSPYLKHHALRMIDAVYVSHANADHYNALAAGMERHPVKAVKMTPYFRAHAAGSGEAKLLLEALGRAGVAVEEIAAGYAAELEDGVRLEVLWPPVGRTLLPNDSSLVVRLVVSGKVILFTGDIQERAMRVMLQTPEKLKCDVLIGPHHGSAEASTEAFLEACGAKHVVSSSDGRLSRKQRKFDELANARQHLRTSRAGAVFVDVGKEGEMKVTSFR